RNLRNSRTRDFRSSASGMEISVGMKQNNSTRGEWQSYRAFAGANVDIPYFQALAAASASTIICGRNRPASVWLARSRGEKLFHLPSSDHGHRAQLFPG